MKDDRTPATTSGSVDVVAKGRRQDTKHVQAQLERVRGELDDAVARLHTLKKENVRSAVRATNARLTLSVVHDRSLSRDIERVCSRPFVILNINS